MMTHRGERGSGALSTTFGLGVVLLLMVFSSHVLLNLWLQSSIHAVAVDAATQVAVTPVMSPSEQAAAEREALDSATANLGNYADSITLEFIDSSGAEDVVLRVSGEGFDLLPGGARLGIGQLDHEIRVAREIPR